VSKPRLPGNKQKRSDAIGLSGKLPAIKKFIWVAAIAAAAFATTAIWGEEMRAGLGKLFDWLWASIAG